MDGRLLAFLGISIVLIITPGPDMAMVTKNALSQGRRGALLTTLGIGSAILLHATVAALGLSALLRTAASLFILVKLCGAAYLIYLGMRALLATRTRGNVTPSSAGEPVTRKDPRHTAYRQGLLSALLSPKLIVFFATFLPQFIGPRQAPLPHMLLLGVIFDVLGVMWLTSYGLLVTRLRAFFASARVRRRMERATGIVLIALGARLALERS